MDILTFEKFKILLEAKEDPSEPIQTPAPEPPDDEPVEAPAEEPAETPAPDVPATDTGSAFDADQSASTPSQPISSDPFGQAPDPFAQQTLPEDPNAAPVETTSSSIKLTIIDPNKKWHIKYTESGGIKRFTEYEVDLKDLDNWISTNGLDSRKQEIYDGVNGKKSLSSDLLTKLKNELHSKKIGKDLGEVDVAFDDKLVPSTSNLDLVFVTGK